MRNISFGWTYPALLAGRKKKTRRDWKLSYAESFKSGESVSASDKDFRYGGKRIATIKLIANPTLEPLSAMPDEDYENEGFAYLNENRHLLPPSMPYCVSWEGFCAWRKSGAWLWVVSFELIYAE